MTLDSLELQLASAVHRYNALQRRAEARREPAAVLAKSLAELGTVLEEVRVAQEQLIESRSQVERLQEQLREEADKYWRLFDSMPDVYVVTRPDTTIVEANRAAAQLFNVSQRFLIGKTLSVFVCEDRTAFLAASSRAATEDGAQEILLKLRPRERAPLTMTARVNGDAQTLRWLLRPSSVGQADASL